MPSNESHGSPVTGVIRLPGGRRLAYAEYGDPHGMPVIHHHGTPGSRLDRAAGPEYYRVMGVRVITPDRPGYGLSDPDPRGTLGDWARDVERLADSLELRTFRLTALSGGGIFALAAAAAMPDRVSAVALTGCPGPMERPGALHGMRGLTRSGIWLGRRAPWAVDAGTSLLSGTIRRFPGFFVQGANHDKPVPDRRWLAMRSVKIEAESTLAEAFRAGAAGYAHDVRLLSRPWDFSLRAVTAPVHLWHGDEDNVIPLHHAMYLASMLPDATLRICQGEGHMVMWSHLGEVLRGSAGARPALAV